MNKRGITKLTTKMMKKDKTDEAIVNRLLKVSDFSEERTKIDFPFLKRNNVLDR